MNANPSNGTSTTALSMGVVAALLFWVPILGFVLGVLAIVLDSVGLAQFKRGESTNELAALWGLALGLAAIIPTVVVLAVLGFTL